MQKDVKDWPFRSKPLRFGFRRAQRLTQRHQFNRVFRQASVRRTYPSLRLFASPNEGTTPRLGIVVGKRAIRRAVDRNRLKRAIRESFRNAQHRLPSMDIVIQATQGKDDKNNSTEVEHALAQLWKGLEGDA